MFIVCLLSASHFTLTIPLIFHSKSGCIIFNGEKMEAQTPYPKAHNQHWQNQVGRPQSYHSTSELCLQPRNDQLKIIPFSLKAGCFFISWWPATDQAWTCFILPGMQQIQILHIHFAKNTPGTFLVMLMHSQLKAQTSSFYFHGSTHNIHMHNSVFNKPSLMMVAMTLCFEGLQEAINISITEAIYSFSFSPMLSLQSCW